MNKKSLGAMVLLVAMCIFTWHWALAFEIMLFEVVAHKFLYPVIADLCSGKWGRDSFKEVLMKDDRLQFGFVISVILYLMIFWGIGSWLINCFGVVSVLMAIVYILMPILGIYKNYQLKK